MSFQGCHQGLGARGLGTVQFPHLPSLVFVFVSFLGFAFVVYFIGLASYLLRFSKTHEL